MKSKTYYLFRHGETKTSKRDGIYLLDYFSASILPEAYPPLERMGEFLKTVPSTYHVSSQFYRCRQTTAIITKHTKKEFIFDKRLNDFSLETPHHYGKRIRSILHDLEALPDTHIMICTHGGNIETITDLLIKKDFSVLKNMKRLLHPTKPGKLVIITNNTKKEIDFNTV